MSQGCEHEVCVPVGTPVVPVGVPTLGRGCLPQPRPDTPPSPGVTAGRRCVWKRPHPSLFYGSRPLSVAEEMRLPPALSRGTVRAAGLGAGCSCSEHGLAGQSGLPSWGPACGDVQRQSRRGESGLLLCSCGLLLGICPHPGQPAAPLFNWVVTEVGRPRHPYWAETCWGARGAGAVCFVQR